MPLPAGSRIGSYEVVEPIGAGGMGEVYRAVDTRLKRSVALKVLPPSLQQDGERLARFQREAELLAALNHPNIAQIYGVEHTDSANALVMELAEGPTLADRIAQGPLPIADALAIARQLLDALDVAHERGIIHRDLKPANIKVSAEGQVKVLDFGLAKATDPTASSGLAAGTSATITSPALTAMGMILGTAAYMAPEQAKGRAVDRRADLWAFGCVLYEMLTGTRAFPGDDVTDTIANVMKSEADLGALPESLPPRIRRVIAACLQKDPKQRLASAQDVRLALDGAFETQTAAVATTAPPRSVWARALPYLVGAVAAAAGLGALAWRLAPEPEPAIVSRFTVTLPQGQNLRNIGRPLVAVSPDGRSFVYNADGGLRLRSMSEVEPRIIAGTEAGLTNPTFSPSGEQIAFYASGDLKRVSISGGGATVIAHGIDNPFGIDWADNGTILFATSKGILRVADAGGTPELVIPGTGTERFGQPQLLPGGSAVLFSVTTAAGDTAWDQAQVVVHSLSSGERTIVLQTGRDGRYLPTGHLVYAVEDDLYAVPFDPESLRVTGAAIALAQGMWWRNSAHANWSVSRNGTLVHVPDLPIESLHPVWVRRDGAIAPIDQIPGGTTPRLSPIGKHLLLEVSGDVWIYEIDTGRRTRVTTDGLSGRPAWHPDGTQIAYSSSRSGSEEVWIAPIDGTGSHRQVTDMPGAAHVDSWSPDGKTLAFHHHTPGDRANEILTITPADPNATPQPLVQRDFHAESAVFSPDGRYVAYLLAETGTREVYIKPFFGPGVQEPVSVGGAREPVWGRNGELFYRSADGSRVMAVKVATSPALSVGTPTELFTGSFFVTGRGGSPRPQFDVTADGQQLFLLQLDSAVRAQIVVVQNWFEELRRLK